MLEHLIIAGHLVAVFKTRSPSSIIILGDKNLNMGIGMTAE
jgi:hypothetical protein